MKTHWTHDDYNNDIDIVIKTKTKLMVMEMSISHKFQ